MGPRKNQNKAAAGLDLLAKVVHKAVKRWTAKSPKTYRVLTDIGTGVAIAGMVTSFISLPPWAGILVGALVSIGSKFTEEKDKPNNP